MMTFAAHAMGYHVAVLDPEDNCPASQCADRHFVPGENWEWNQDTDEFAELCDVITLEFENIDRGLIAKLGEMKPMHPGAEFLGICQDRITEKKSLESAGIPVAPNRQVTDQGELSAVLDALPFPFVLKTSRCGYDGKGQQLVHTADDAYSAWERFDHQPLIAEAWIEHIAEVSVISARNRAGHFESFPMFENAHSNHILDVTTCPVREDLRDIEEAAIAICRTIAESFEVIGLFCVEFFVTADHRLMVNEIAPRPHNSGHLTIEATTLSQFEQQVRAVCNLPLSKPRLLGSASMANLLGHLWENGEPNWSAALDKSTCDHAVSLHLYGKSEPRPGRKMGHLTVVGLGTDSKHCTADVARACRKALD